MNKDMIIEMLENEIDIDNEYLKNEIINILIDDDNLNFIKQYQDMDSIIENLQSCNYTTSDKCVIIPKNEYENIYEECNRTLYKVVDTFSVYDEIECLNDLLYLMKLEYIKNYLDENYDLIDKIIECLETKKQYNNYLLINELKNQYNNEPDENIKQFIKGIANGIKWYEEYLNDEMQYDEMCNHIQTIIKYLKMV